MTLQGKHNNQGTIDVKFNRSQLFTIIAAFAFSVIVPLAVSYSNYKVFRSETEDFINKQKKFNKNVVNSFKLNKLKIDEFANYYENEHN